MFDAYWDLDGTYFVCDYCVQYRDAGEGLRLARLRPCPRCVNGRIGRRFYIDCYGRIHRSFDCLTDMLETGEAVTERPVKPQVMNEPEPSVTPRRASPKPEQPVTEPERAEPVTVTPGTRKCGHCDTPFTPARSDARYCQPRCRVAAHRAKRAEAS